MKAFSELIKREIESIVPSTTEVRIQTVTKNNGTSYTGCIIKPADTNIAPTIYLESFFERYEKGEDVSSLAREIVRLAEENQPDEAFNVDYIMDWDSVKDKIFYQLVNYKANETKLNIVPYVDIQDLAFVFKILVSNDGDDLATCLVTDQLMDAWKISIDELAQAAMENTPKLFPAKVEDMFTIMKEVMGDMFSPELLPPMDGPQMIVITNQAKQNGAGVILYPHVLEEICKNYKANYLAIIPSSIHEVVVIPVTEALDIDDLTPMIQEVNTELLEPEEILSDHYYTWTPESGLQMPEEN